MTTDPFDEDSYDIFSIEIDPSATIRDMKKKIQESHDWHPSEQSLYHWICPLDDTKVVYECLEDCDTITATINGQDTNESAILANSSNEKIFLITGTKEKFKIIPSLVNSKRRIPKSFFARSVKFGVCRKKETGTDGKGIFCCNIYNATDGTEVEIENQSVYQIHNYKRELLNVREEKTFSERDIIKGFLSKKMKDVLEVITAVTGVAGVVTEVVGVV